MRLRRGQIVCVRFMDHVQGDDKMMEFNVYGELAGIFPTHLVVDSWAYSDKRKKHDHNETRYTICRSAVQEVTVLGPR